MEWYLGALKKYADFSGRARRKEYWMFVLINLLIVLVIAFIEGAVGSPGTLGALYSLAVLIPSIAVGVRRLHDSSRSGWWLLISFVPLVGMLILIYFMVQDSDDGQNEFGASPKLEAA